MTRHWKLVRHRPTDNAGLRSPEEIIETLEPMVRELIDEQVLDRETIARLTRGLHAIAADNTTRADYLREAAHRLLEGGEAGL